MAYESARGISFTSCCGLKLSAGTYVVFKRYVQLNKLFNVLGKVSFLCGFILESWGVDTMLSRWINSS